MDKQKKEILQRIARHLMLHSSFMREIGLLEGKMGVSIFFFHYAMYTDKEIYHDFGDELIDEIYDEIHEGYPLNFKKGLSGIAWGMEYLIRNEFIDADPDEVLEELDAKILEWDVRRINDTSLETGSIGLAYYIISRCANKNKRSSNIPDDYISDLVTSLKSKMSNNDRYYHVIESLTTILSGGSVLKIENPLIKLCESSNYKEDSFFQVNYPLGIINNGFTGVGLNLMKNYET